MINLNYLFNKKNNPRYKIKEHRRKIMEIMSSDSLDQDEKNLKVKEHFRGVQRILKEEFSKIEQQF